MQSSLKEFMALVRIPTPLQSLTGNQGEVNASGSTVSELIDNLESNHAGIKSRICDDEGNIRRFVNIYVNDEDIRFLDGKNTAIADDAEVSIVPAIAGGR